MPSKAPGAVLCSAVQATPFLCCCSAQGISLSANVAELAAYSVMISYNVNLSE